MNAVFQLLYRAVDLFLEVFYVALIIRILFSFFRPSPFSVWDRLDRLVYSMTEPVLGPIRRALPTFGGFDFSPLVAWFLLGLVRELIGTVLRWLQNLLS